MEVIDNNVVTGASRDSESSNGVRLSDPCMYPQMMPPMKFKPILDHYY